MFQLINTILIGLTSGAIYSLMAMAIVLVWRSTRVINFAQAGQAILSTYIGYIVISHTDNYWLALPVALVAGGFIGGVVDIQFARLAKRLLERKITLKLDEKARDWLAEHGYDPLYGARPLKRIMQKEIQDKDEKTIVEAQRLFAIELFHRRAAS